ncbi:MAG: cyclic nucleotide-binding domain-containing protein [Xanthobacteraceae bacterium]
MSTGYYVSSCRQSATEISEWPGNTLILPAQMTTARKIVSTARVSVNRRVLIIIQSGEVEIRLGNRVLETLPQYSIFGEMALIDNAPRSATAIAASDAKLVPVSEKRFLFLISNTPYFALNVMRIMARRLRAANTAL